MRKSAVLNSTWHLSVFTALALSILTGHAQSNSPKPVELRTSDGGTVQGDLYGAGQHGVVLAHGGRFNKGSWEKQARELAKAGYRVLAIDFRGYGQSKGPGQGDIFTAPLHLDVLAAVGTCARRARRQFPRFGGSLGGGAAAAAAIAEPRAIDRLILLGSTPDGPPDKLSVRKLYIATRDDASGDGPRLPGLQAHFNGAPEPKQLILLEGSAHAQFMFQTDQADRVMREILRFLSAP